MLTIILKERTIGPMVQTKFDFVDDIAPVPESVEKAQALPLSVDGECK